MNRQRSADDGISLVEVLVAMGLFGVLTTVLLGFALGTSQVTRDTQRLSDSNDRARLVLERMTRELRQADEILGFETSSSLVRLQFHVDFDGQPGERATDRETLTYRWVQGPTGDGSLFLNAVGDGIPESLMATGVSGFSVNLFSSAWEYDADGSGKTELDEVNSDLSLIDLVEIDVEVQTGSGSRIYETSTSLRNRRQT